MSAPSATTTFERGEVTSTKLSSELTEVKPKVLLTDSSLDDLENSSKLELFDILQRREK